MATSSYPLVCWQIGEESVFGLLLGTDLQAVERNTRRLKTALAETLQRERERGRPLPEPELDEARMKLVTVKVNLAHRTAKGSFAVPTATEFTVAAIYGGNAVEGYSKCYLPYLDESFYYYDDGQLPVLIEHYTRDRLDGMAPEDAQRYLMPTRPWLEQVEWRKDDRTPDRQRLPRYLRDAHARLAVVADRLPETGARRGQHVFPETAWEQGALVDELAGRLARGANLLLVGEPGVGKSVAILEAIRKAHRLTAGTEQPFTFWRSNAERLIGRAKYLGEWQALCDQLVQWLEMSEGLLWVTDFVHLLQTGGDNAEDSMAAYLLPALRRGALRLVGEATPEELESARRRLPAFIDCFEPLRLAEMDGTRARRVLDLFAGHAKNALSIEIEPAALDTGYRLLQRYVRYERFPGKAVKFFGECVRSAMADRLPAVSEQAAIAHFARTTGLPEAFLRDDRPLVEEEVRHFFGQRLFGQHAVIGHLQDVVYLFKAGLNDPAKPIATLLFAGPTGVGKTAAAKALAAYFFGAGSGADPLFRIDMSEFQHSFQIARLVGTGERPGKLVEHVRQRPFSVVLLDEIEKADPSVFDLLLGVLDEGRLRDSRGRVTDFRSSLVVMTTNLGVRHGASLGFTEAGGGDTVLQDIRQFFRPEFFNRIDRVVPFAPLSREAIEAIALQELRGIERREGLLRRGMSLRFSPAVVAFVAGVGFSPRYGARPLQRAVEQHVVAAVARALFEVVDDGVCLEVEMAGDTVVARPAAGP
ncbi:AAA family ATPase [Aquabacterium sp. A7-Y]|uniref:AAA family ATPase n=1 Tax=Aquabacterium sp. A7-Y TaxID=1349605 RepID=UPI00223CDC30|nr:AAA family ATPase [Aquabacterium sp. A7-Y]MCW7538709.1 AAA family ATPase [Aquabacterium sp. A7-Y]